MTGPWYNYLPFAFIVFFLGVSIYNLISHLAILSIYKITTATCISVERANAKPGANFFYRVAIDNHPAIIKNTTSFDHPFYLRQGESVKTLFKNDKEEVYTLTFYGFWRTALGWLLLAILITGSLLASYKDFFIEVFNFEAVAIETYLSILVSLGSFYFVYEDLRRLTYLKKDSQKTTGTIVSYTEHLDSDNQMFFYPIVNFTTATGQEVYFVSGIGYPRKRDTHTSVTVLYNTRFPEFAEINNWIAIHFKLLFFAIFALAAGLGALLI